MVDHPVFALRRSHPSSQEEGTRVVGCLLSTVPPAGRLWSVLYQGMGCHQNLSIDDRRDGQRGEGSHEKGGGPLRAAVPHSEVIHLTLVADWSILNLETVAWISTSVED